MARETRALPGRSSGGLQRGKKTVSDGVKTTEPRNPTVIDLASECRLPEGFLIKFSGPRTHSASPGKRKQRWRSSWKKTDLRIRQNRGFQTGNFRGFQNVAKKPRPKLG